MSWIFTLLITFVLTLSLPAETAHAGDSKTLNAGAQKKARKAPPAPPRRGQATKAQKPHNINVQVSPKDKPQPKAMEAKAIKKKQANTQPQPKQEPQSKLATKKPRQQASSKSQGQQKKVQQKKTKLKASPQKAQAAKAKKEKRQPSSQFKAGMYKFKECTMHAEASASSSPEGQISQGKKLWVDAHSPNWHKVYKKSGAVFVPADCLQ